MRGTVASYNDFNYLIGRATIIFEIKGIVFHQTKFYIFQSTQRMKKILSPDKLYNLFSNGIIPQSPISKSQSKSKKTQIQVVFHHPNLLYLSNKKQKSKEDVAREVEQRLMERVHRKNKLLTEKIKEQVRPSTSDVTIRTYHRKESENNQNRCFTSQQGRKVRFANNDSNLSPELKVLGNSSTFSGSFFDKTNTQGLQKQSISTKTLDIPQNHYTSKKNQTSCIFDYLQSTKGFGKFETWKSMLSKSNLKPAVRLNMCLDIQKKFLRYNTNKLKVTSNFRHFRTYVQ